VGPVDAVTAVAQPPRARLQPVDRPQPVAFAVRVQHHVGDVDVPVLGDGDGLAEALQVEVAGMFGHAGAHHPTAASPRGLHRLGQEVDGVVDGGEEGVDLWGERRGQEVSRYHQQLQRAMVMSIGQCHWPRPSPAKHVGHGHLYPTLLATVISTQACWPWSSPTKPVGHGHLYPMLLAVVIFTQSFWP